MIVVMAIIGVLAAILIPTLRAAMVRAKVTAIAGDLANLDAALNQFKEKYGNYPTDFSNPNVLTRFIQKAWPRITAGVAGAQLWVIGEGDDRPRLEAKARELGVEPRTLLGRAQPVNPYVR